MTSQLCFSRTKPSRKAIVPSYRGRVKINTGSLGYLDFGTVSILSASSSSESLDQVEQKISNLTMMMISSLFSLPFFWLMYLEKWCRKSLDMPSNLLIANKYFKWGTTLHNNQKWQSKIILANFNFLCRNIKASRHEAHKVNKTLAALRFIYSLTHASMSNSSNPWQSELAACHLSIVAPHVSIDRSLNN